MSGLHSSKMPIPEHSAKADVTMPKGTVSIPATSIGTTPVPNSLFDLVMPTLSDTQLRVLLVVARSTLGWREGDGRKQSDWLSHRQLQSRTGRAGAAVSGAIDALVRRGLLEVQDAAGERRVTSSSRRSVRGPLFYRLGQVLTFQQPLATQPSTSQSEVVNPIINRTVEEAYSADRTPERTSSTSERRLHKAKTTKENETKERKNSREIRFDLSSLGSEVLSIGMERIAELQELPVDLSTQTTVRHETEILQNTNTTGNGLLAGDGTLQRGEVPATATYSNEAEAFVRHFQSAYATARPDQVCPPIEIDDFESLEHYLERHGTALLERWLPAFFACDFGYVRRRGWSLGSYLDSIFVLQAKKGQSAFIR